MKKLIIFIAIFLSAENLHIISKQFFYNSKTKVSTFIGDVNATKGKDNVLSNKMKIFFNRNKKPIKYIATGKVRFILSLDKNSTYKGHCDKLIYNFKTYDIYLIGNAYIKKLETNESVSGNFIKMNRKTKNVEVEGGNKPANIIIKVNE